MKRLIEIVAGTLMCMAALMLMTACGGEKKGTVTTGKEKVDEIVEEAIEEFDKMSDIGKFESVLKSYKLSLKDVAPEFAYKEKNENDKSNFYGKKSETENIGSALFMKEDGTDITQEEYDAFVKKLYEATKGVSQDGKNVRGFMLEDKLEGALNELPLDSLTGKKLFGMPWNLIDWTFRQNDTFYGVSTDLKEGKSGKQNRISFKISQSIQKSIKETMDDAEKALSDPEVQKAIKEKLGK
ncbi:MAG: hypothetical protein IKX65_03670 [Prevotella sp.]|nr:hypothetical protein [Prevotella sp.]